MYGYTNSKGEKVFLGHHGETAIKICIEVGRELEVFAQTFEYPRSALLIANLQARGII